MLSNHGTSDFDSLLDAVIVADRQGNIVQINPAAVRVFDLASEACCRGTLYQHFLEQYAIDDAQQLALSLDPWLMHLLTSKEGAESSSPQEEIQLLQLPSGQQRYFAIRNSPRYDAHGHVAGMVHVFCDIAHHYQQALRIQRVHRAVLKLTAAIGRTYEQMELPFRQDTFLLSPAARAIEQQLVEVVCQVLDGRLVAIWTQGPPAGQLYVAAGTGFTELEQQRRQALSGRYLPQEILGQRVLDRLRNGEAVTLPDVVLRLLPPELRAGDGVKRWLMVPLLLEEQLAGALVIGQDNVDADFTPWEIELVNVVATHTMLLLDCIRCWGQAQAEGRTLAQQEIERLIDDFLNLASHEFNTSLTTIKGNVQVAQRRWAALKRQLAVQGASVSEKMERVEDTLEATVKSVRLQERMLEDLIDDTRIQAHKLALSLHRHDLRALLREAVESAQRSAPGHPIVLESLPSANGVPVLADAGRIRRVITTYLEQALRCSPPDQPVTVRLTGEQIDGSPLCP